MKKYLKENIKNLPFILVAFIMFYGITTLATNYLFNSNEVSYDNSETGLHADEVQGAIDEVFQHATDYTDINNRLTNIENNFLNKTYPIGSIYISTADSTASAVHDRFGGTWEAYATGRTLIGMGSNGTNNYTTINDTGGASSHTIAVTNLPVHNHSIPSLSGTAASSGSAHSHTSPTYMGGYVFYVSNVAGGSNFQISGGSGDWYKSANMPNSGAHTHTVTTNASNTNGCTNCNGTALSTIDPYITVYMWKRTA